jgi:hypothetical protein
MSNYPVERLCAHCSTMFTIPNAMFKNKRFCSLSCGNKGRSTRSKEQYQQSPKPCLLCEGPIAYEARHSNKFCSSSCACTYNNKQRTPEHHKRHGDKIRNLYSSKQKPVQSKTNVCTSSSIKPDLIITSVEPVRYNQCKVCNQLFGVKNKHSAKKSCSRECESVLYQRAGRQSATTRCLRSKQEVQLYNLCVNYYSDVKHNEVIADGWDADIIIPSKKVAILWNGPWHYRQMPVSNHSLVQVQNRDRIKIQLFESLGWQVFVFEDRYYSPESAFQYLHQHILR